MISKVNNILVVSFLALAVFTINSYATRGNIWSIFILKLKSFWKSNFLLRTLELKAQAASEALYCYNCNENLKACSYPYNYTALENYSVPCNGFCVKFQNRFDENSIFFYSYSSV